MPVAGNLSEIEPLAVEITTETGRFGQVIVSTHFLSVKGGFAKPEHGQ
jgi:hypothetical protein